MSSGMNGTKSRGVFSSVAEMQEADLRVGTTVWVYGGSRYDIYATDQGSSAQLNNGHWAKEISGSTTWGDVNGELTNQADLISALNEKQQTLVSGDNIKTVGGQSLLGSGDIPLSASGGLDPKYATFTQISSLSATTAGVIPFNDATKFTFSSETLDISTNASGIVLNPGNYYIKCVSHVSKGSASVITGNLRIKSVVGDSIDVLLDSCINISESLYNLSGSDMIKITNQTVIELALAVDSTAQFTSNPPSLTRIPYDIRITKL